MDAGGGDRRRASILAYVRETAEEAGIDRHIRFGHRVVRASWSGERARWTVEARHDGAPVTLTARFLYVCGGYYHYDGGHTPDFPGVARFRGTIVHPQRSPRASTTPGRTWW